MQRRVILASSLTNPEKLKHLTKENAVWIYAGENINRFKIFENTFDKKLFCLHPKQYHDFIDTRRKDFVEWTETVHNQYGSSSIHWLSDTFSSNPYMSKLFLHNMNLAWFQNVINVYPNKDVVLISESYALLRAAEKIVAADRDREIHKIGYYKGKKRFLYKAVITTLKGYAILLIFALRRLVVCFNPTKLNNTEMQNVPVIIDTHIFENSFDNVGTFKNKYFTELHGFFKKIGLQVVVYPIFHGISFKNFIILLKSIRKCKIKFILPEDYLKISDYFDVLLTMFKHFKHFEKVQHFLGIDVQSVVDEENWIKGCSPSFVMAMIMHKLPKRLYDSGFSLKLYINWSENQTIHRAIILGFHRHFKNIEVVGGKPFVPPVNHLNLFGTPSERVFGVAPDRAITCGKKLKTMFLLYDQNGQYEVGASFRYGYLQDIVDKNNYGQNVELITVFLPYHLETSKYILFLASVALRKAIDKGFKVIIKIHPSILGKELRLLLNVIKFQDSRIEIIQEDQKFLLQRSAAIITSASSVACEAICLGVPAVLIGMPIGLDFNMHDYMPSSMWRLAYSEDEFDFFLNKWALQHPLSFHERREIGKRLMENIFEPNTEQTMSVYSVSAE
ncbi:MAG TPA: hypothetical protein ACFYD0_09280 [Candidatus Wunengus sp. YC65]|uniref:hypothetical protein n=1 Tax=Candidatus Wunengus sp. YC65 TaxID=3367701 RepID=UPI004029F14F